MENDPVDKPTEFYYPPDDQLCCPEPIKRRTIKGDTRGRLGAAEYVTD